MSRSTPYAFACGRCCRCCRNKIIQVNPYEVARLAAHTGLSTTSFIRLHTVESGSHLRFDTNHVCPFLGKEGCGVHAARPLVCRLYPLGRHIAENGEEWFTELEADAGCKGARGAKATVLAYLESQGALPFMRAADLYLNLYWRLAATLNDGAEAETRKCGRKSPWTDLDTAVRRYCREARRKEPESVEERMELHIQAIEAWAQPPKKGGA